MGLREAKPSGPIPNIFVVGAPKCGTTSLCNYLSQHPQIFFPTKKEPLYFCSDDGHREPWAVRNLDEYLALFADARDAKVIGEGSVWYLESEKALERIYKFDPSAKIIIMLRNPVDMIVSLHSQFLYSGNEAIRDFRAAYALSAARRCGKKIPLAAHYPAGLCYSEEGRYFDKVKRYLDKFGRQNVKVIIFEEFFNDIAAAYRDVLGFLDVDVEFEADFATLNERRVVRFISLQRVLWKTEPLWGVRWLPGSRFRDALHWRLARVRQKLFSWNVIKGQRAQIPVAVRDTLRRDFADDVHALEKLLNKDLRYWA
jgi:hypothetical protein